MTMGNLDRIATLVAFLLLASMPAAVGQSQHARLDEEREARDLRVEKIRSKLAEVRKSEKRPTVALVLSGGGAKGAAHVGVIRYLESIGMPVDVVLGTSMGGLVGGLYSLGYDAGQLDTLIRGIDWDMALSDKVPRDYLSYTRVKYKEKFVVSFPFYYSKDDYIRQKEDDNRYPRRSDDQLHFGADQADASDLVKDNILGSLPSGMVYGQNVSNIFSSMSVGYQDEIDFYDLPIPFICVATDLVTGTAKIWTRGKINTALRSTMSIPGLFAPVKTDGMVLVDGGMRNNYPTDLARKIGADIIIGVNLSSGYRTYSEINNLGEIIDSGIDLMGRSSFESNVDIPDVTLKPDLTGYNMLSFTPASIDTIIRKGYESALAEAPALDSLLRLTGSAGTKLRNRKAEDLGARKVMIDGIEVTGVSDKESLFLQDRMKMFAGTRMGKDEIEDAVANIFGTNAFDYVNYELHGSQEPYRLELKCKKGPISQVGFGFRVDTEEIVSVLLNIGIGVLVALAELVVDNSIRPHKGRCVIILPLYKFNLFTCHRDSNIGKEKCLTVWSVIRKVQYLIGHSLKSTARYLGAVEYQIHDIVVVNILCYPTAEELANSLGVHLGDLIAINLYKRDILWVIFILISGIAVKL